MARPSVSTGCVAYWPRRFPVPTFAMIFTRPPLFVDIFDVAGEVTLAQPIAIRVSLGTSRPSVWAAVSSPCPLARKRLLSMPARIH
jgi:hypothetical protein